MWAPGLGNPVAAEFGYPAAMRTFGFVGRITEKGRLLAKTARGHNRSLAGGVQFKRVGVVWFDFH
jgi:hypothetical protein